MRKGVSLLLFAVAGCAPTLRQRVQALKNEQCPVVLEARERMVKEPGYAEESYRARFDLDVDAARCWLSWRRPERALEIANAIDDAQEGSEVLMIQARAQAQLAQDDAARATIERLAKHPIGVPAHYFWEHPELARYAQTDWYVAAALNVAHAEGKPVLDVVGRLARASGTQLLGLPIAAADGQRAPGEWVVWMGAVRDTKLDRARNRTLLLVDGMTSRERLAMVDRKVTSVDQHFGGGITANYEEHRTYEEELVPMGQQFVVEQDGVDERLVSLRTVVVVGRYAGRTDKDLPKVRPMAILEHKLGSRTE